MAVLEEDPPVAESPADPPPQSLDLSIKKYGVEEVTEDQLQKEQTPDLAAAIKKYGVEEVSEKDLAGKPAPTLSLDAAMKKYGVEEAKPEEATSATTISIGGKPYATLPEGSTDLVAAVVGASQPAQQSGGIQTPPLGQPPPPGTPAPNLQTPTMSAAPVSPWRVPGHPELDPEEMAPGLASFARTPLLPESFVSDAVKQTQAWERENELNRSPGAAAARGAVTGVVEGGRSLVRGLSSPINLALQAAGLGERVILSRIQAVTEDISLLGEALQGAQAAGGVDAAGSGLGDELISSVDRLKKLEALRAMVSSGQAATGGAFSLEGAKQLVEAQTWSERLAAAGQVAGGAAMAISGARGASKPSPYTENLIENERLANATSVGRGPGTPPEPPPGPPPPPRTAIEGDVPPPLVPPERRLPPDAVSSKPPESTEPPKPSGGGTGVTPDQIDTDAALKDLAANHPDSPAAKTAFYALKQAGWSLEKINAEVDKIKASPIETAIDKHGVEEVSPGDVPRGTAIAEAEPPKREYSSTQVQMPPEVAKRVAAFAEKIPDADLAPKGRQPANDIHATLAFGGHGDDPEEVRQLIEHNPPFTATLGKTMAFPAGEDGVPLVFAATSPDMERINGELREGLPHTDTHDTYQIHVTAAYLKPGTEDKYTDDDSLEGTKVTFDSVTFSGKDGTKTVIPLKGVAGGQQLDEGAGGTPSPAGPPGAAPEPAAPGVTPTGAETVSKPKETVSSGPSREEVAGPPYKAGDKVEFKDYDGTWKPTEVTGPTEEDGSTPIYHPTLRMQAMWPPGAPSQRTKISAKPNEIRPIGSTEEPEKPAKPAVADTKTGPSDAASTEKPAEELGTLPKGVTVSYNSGRHSIEIKFPAKPEIPTLHKLRAAGYKWAKSTKTWYRPLRALPTDQHEAQVKAALAQGHELAGAVTTASQPSTKPVTPSQAPVSHLKIGDRVDSWQGKGTIESLTATDVRIYLEDKGEQKSKWMPLKDVKKIEPKAAEAPKKTTSYKAEITDGSGYGSNALRFATKEEATAYAEHKMDTWMAAKDYRIVETEDPVNYRWDAKEGAVQIEPKAPAATTSAPPVPTPKHPESLALQVYAALTSKGWPDAKNAGEFRKIVAERIGVPEQTLVEDIDALNDGAEAALLDTFQPSDDLAESLVRAQKAEALLPHAHRTLEKTKLQQFSTPLPIAVMAAHAADIHPGDRVLEPTAGTGNLLAPLKDRSDITILAAELAPRRADLLRAQGYNVVEGDYLAATVTKPTVILTNPPWGKYSKGKYGKAIALGFDPTDVAERFIGKNMRDLAPDGRLVAVMPTTLLNSKSVKGWLRANFTVQAVIQAPPHAYDTRATNVESVLLVVDKTVPPKGAPLVFPKTVVPATWEAYAQAVQGIHGRTVLPVAPEGRPREAPPAAPERVPGAVPERPRPELAEPGRNPPVAGGRHPGVVAHQPGSAPERQPEGPGAPVVDQPDRATLGALATAEGEFADVVDHSADDRRTAAGSRHFAPYVRRTALRGVGHPKLIVEARQLAGVAYPPLTEKPGRAITTALLEKRVSIEQAEQALAAIQANVTNHHGYLAADNVGVGKSREIALTILDLMERAKADNRDLRLVVTTKSADNIANLIDEELYYVATGRTRDGRDLLNVDAPKVVPESLDFEIVRTAEWPDAKREGQEYKPLPLVKRGIYVTDFYNLSPFRQALVDIQPHGIIGDEAHRFKNVEGAAAGGAWQNLHAQIIRNIEREQQVFAYFTATPAQNVSDYQYLYGLRLWPIDGFTQWVRLATGEGNEKDAEALIRATDAGAFDIDRVADAGGDAVVGGDSEDTAPTRRPLAGRSYSDIFTSRLTPAEAEQIPREWKMLGRFSARDLWRAGQEFTIHEAKLAAHHVAKYDQFVDLAQEIAKAAARFALLDKSGKSSRFGVTGQLQFAAKRIQMQPALEEAIRVAQAKIAEGYQVVLSVINVSEMDPEHGNIAAAIEKINARIKDIDPDDPDGGTIDMGEIPEAIVAKAELLERAKALGKFDDPIDMIKAAFGNDKVAFIIGGSGTTRRVETKQFQEGRRVVAVLSAAGSTGINLDHRVLTDQMPAQGRRLFIDVQYEWSATEAIQRYGRVGRAASVTQPILMPLTFGNASEKKFLATIANRMASLGALSKGGAETTGAAGLEEFEITGPDAAQAARLAYNDLSQEDKRKFAVVKSVFRSPNRANDDMFEPASTAPASAGMRDFQLALLFVPMKTSNAFWQAFVAHREVVREQLGHLSTRTEAFTGDILRTTTLGTPEQPLTLTEVKNQRGKRFGILSGLITPRMPKVRDFLTAEDPETGHRSFRRQYVTFTAGNAIVSGLQIPWSRVKALAEAFGHLIAGEVLNTPAKVLGALKAGDRVALQQEVDGDPSKTWTLKWRGKDEKIAIDGAKMADRALLLHNAGAYSPVGNFWFTTEEKLPQFLERFPVAAPKHTTSFEDDLNSLPDNDDDGTPSVQFSRAVLPFDRSARIETADPYAKAKALYLERVYGGTHPFTTRPAMSAIHMAVALRDAGFRFPAKTKAERLAHHDRVRQLTQEVESEEADRVRRASLDPNAPQFSRYEPLPVYYSALTRAAEELPQAKGQPAQMFAMLVKAKGVKPDEIALTGLRPWMLAHEGSITKAAIVDYLKANELHLEETLYSSSEDQMAAQAQLDDLARLGSDRTPEQEREYDLLARRLIHGQGYGKEPKFGHYVEEGGTNYREMTLRLPEVKLTPEAKIAAQRLQEAETAEAEVRNAAGRAVDEQYRERLNAAYEQLVAASSADDPGRAQVARLALDRLQRQYAGEKAFAENSSVLNHSTVAANTDRARAAFEKLRDAARKENFTEGHYDEPNVVAHVRWNDRTDTQGRKVLFIEEIQSDWHQRGRKKGYRQEPQYTEEERELRRLNAKTWERLAGVLTPAETARAAELQAKVGVSLQEKARRASQGMPDAPFKTTWQELALKRMVRFASEHGYDALAWTTGTQQNARYNLANYIDTLRYERDEATGKYHLFAEKDGRDVIAKDDVPAEQLEEYVGKEIAQRILNGEGAEEKDEEGSFARYLTGLQLEVGGAGMKGFYDKILPTYLNKFGKPFGAAVVPVQIADVKGTEKRYGDFVVRQDWQRVTPREAMRIIDERGIDALGIEKPDEDGNIYTLDDLDYEQYLTFANTTDGYPGLGGSVIDMLRNRGWDFQEDEDDEVPANPDAILKLWVKEPTIPAAPGFVAHGFPITDKLREAVLQGVPMFAYADDGRLSPTDRAALDKAYYVMPLWSIGDANVPVYDAGRRLTDNEIASLLTPGVQRIVTAIRDLGRQMVDRLYGEVAGAHVRIGVILDRATFGVYWPNSPDVTILINPFEKASRGGTIEEILDNLRATILHEVTHHEVQGHEQDFNDAYARNLATLGVSFAARAEAQLQEAYADAPHATSLRADVARALSLYTASRGRPATAPDALSRAGGDESRPPDAGGEPNRPAGRAGPDRGRVVTLADLARLAAKLGTTVDVQVARAEAEGYTVQRETPTSTFGGTPTLQATILPGAAEFGEYVLEPAVAEIAKQVRSERNLLLSALAPAKVGVAPKGAANIRAQTSARDQRAARAAKILNPLMPAMDRWSHAEVLDFADVMEGEAPLSSLPSDRRAIAEFFRDLLNGWKEQLIAHDLLEHFLEHYWPHLWAQPSMEVSALRRLFGRRPHQGPESYRKHRTIPTTRFGVEQAHLEPATWNPAEMLLLKIQEMNRSLAARALREDMKRDGLYQYVPATSRVPEALKGWQRVPEYALGTVYGPRVEEQKFGRVIAGYYYAPAEIVRLMENHLSPGLRGKSITFDAWLNGNNFLLGIQLGFSAFHFYLTATEAVVSKLALSLELASQGRWKEAGKLGVEIPVAPILDAYRGRRDLKEFYAQDADADLVDGIIGEVVQGGGGFGWNLFEQNSAPEAFMRALRQGTAAGQRGELGTMGKKAAAAAWKALPASTQLLMRPIMQHWVPWLKMAAYRDRFKAEVATLGPNATLNDIRRIAGESWDAIDDRFGQLRYDNLFWDNRFKQLAMSLIRAVGWRIGTLRTMFMALPSQGRVLGHNAKVLARRAGIHGGGGVPPPPSGTPPGSSEATPGPEDTFEKWLHPRMAWFIAMLLVHAMGATLIMAALAHKRPKTLKDLGFPENGEMDPSGHPRRLALIDYFKDLYAWVTKHPGAVAASALAPYVTIAYEIFENEDYFGTEVRDPDDPLGKQIVDAFGYYLGQHRPISLENADRRGKAHPTKLERAIQWGAQALAPTTPAPASVERSSAEAYLHDLGDRDKRVKTKEEAAQSALTRAIRQGYAAHTPEGFAEAQEAIHSGDLSKGQIQAARKAGLRQQTYLEYGLVHHSLAEALTLYEKATPEQRVSLKRLLQRKYNTDIKLVPKNQWQAIHDRYQVDFRLPTE